MYWADIIKYIESNFIYFIISSNLCFIQQYLLGIKDNINTDLPRFGIELLLMLRLFRDALK